MVSSRVWQVDKVHDKNRLTASMSFREMKSSDSLVKELATQKTKIDNAFKKKPNQNQNGKPLFESDPSNNIVFNSMKTAGEESYVYYEWI